MNEYENHKSIKQHDAEMKSCSTTSGDASKNKSKIVIYPNKDNRMTLHSHEGDVYNAALALLRLPTAAGLSSSTRHDDVSSFQNIKHSVITPQQSFDSSKVSFSSLSTSNYTFSGGLTSFFPNHRKVDSSSSMMDNIPTQKLSEDSTSLHQDNTSVFNSSCTVTSFCGTISLSMPADEDNLSPLHCFIRKFGIEAFVVSENDAKDKEFWNARNFKVKPGIVGMQCMHCKHKPLSERGPKSVHYPSSTKCIYYSMENWQRNHAVYCTSIPKWILRELRTLMSQSKTGAGGRRRYWTDSAIALGMTDTPEGIKFVGATTCPPSMQPEGQMSADSYNQDVDEENHALGALQDVSEKNNLVGEDDKHEISEYLFLLISQMEACSFTEDDRSGSRSKVKDIAVGYPGIQCKHCHGKSGVGRYFPLSLETLTLANSDRNIHNHLQKCRRCPEEVKESLEKLRLDVQNDSYKIKRGARKAFFSRLWYKLHHDGGTKSHGNDIVPISEESSIQHRVETKSSPNLLTGNISNCYADCSKTRRMSVRNDFHYPNVLPSSLDDPLRYFFHPHYPKSWQEQRSSQQTTTRISLQGGNKNSGIVRECSSSTEDPYSHKHYPNHHTFWSSRGQKTYYLNPSDQHQVYHPSYNEDWRSWKRSSTNNIHSCSRMTSWYPHPNRSDSCHHYEEDDHFIHSQSDQNLGTTFIHPCHFPPHTSIDHEGEHQRDVCSITTINDPSTDCRSHCNEDLSGYAEL